MSQPASQSRITHSAALLALSLLWAAGSLRADLLPAGAFSALPPFLSAAIPLALLAVVAAILALLRRSAWPRGRQALSALWITFGLFIAPAWLLHLTHGSVPSLTRVALFSLVPVFAVVLEPHIDPEASRPSFGFAASLAAMLGMLLLFGFQMPSSLTAAAAQCALILAASLIAVANCLAVRATRTLTRGSLSSFAFFVAAAACTLLIASSFLAGEFPLHAAAFAPTLLWSSLVDFPALALLFWLFPRLSALRMTTRFLFAPLLAALVSALILAPRISPFSALGLLVLTASAGWLLFVPAHSAETIDDPAPLRLHRD
jgi:drug/metabolite transporter (DMT)-like permease